LDLASGGQPSYGSYLPNNLKIIKTDYRPKEGVEKIINFNQPLPFSDNEFDNILFFNALYIVENRIGLFNDLRRVLKNNGSLFIASPFINAEMPEPHDYCRLTAEGLEKELREAGFSDIKIERFGERFSCAAYLINVFLYFRIVKLFVYAKVLLLDKWIPRGIKKSQPCPLGYFCEVKK